MTEDMDNPCYLCNKMYLCTKEDVEACLKRKFEQKMKLKILQEMMEDDVQ